MTGAARRIGRAVALALADAGAAVAAHYDRSAAEAEALVAELEGRGVKAAALQADLAAPGGAADLLARAAARLGPVELLVNNASTFEPASLEELTYEGLLGSVTLHGWSPLVLTRALARQGGEGRVVNLLDTRVAALDLGHAGYILGKHVLAEVTRMAAVTWGPRLTVNAVAPGPILPPEGQGEEYLARVAAKLPLRRQGSPEEVARAVLFLLESGYVTGQVLFVDGGRHLLGGTT